MRPNIFIRDEFIAKVNISEDTLKEWEKKNLIKPVGYTDTQIPVYSESSIEKVTHIQNLMGLGYGLEEIKKIVKKVGLPKVNNDHNDHTKYDEYLTVGSLAERVGVSPRTLKHWEDKGIIEPEIRSEGGFRLYPEVYVYLCNLIIDLQLFGYSLEEIKVISNYFRDLRTIQKNSEALPKTDVVAKLEAMLKEINVLYNKMALLKEGIQRWDDLLKKRKKEIVNLKNQIQKKVESNEGEKNE